MYFTPLIALLHENESIGGSVVKFLHASNNKLAVCGRPGSDSRPMQLFLVFLNKIDPLPIAFLNIRKNLW